jgi:hypothetical protein
MELKVSLTPKQEKFAQCIADGMSQADAYRSAFDVRPTTKPETVVQMASRLASDRNVSARVEELKAALSAKALWTREDSVRTLIGVIQGDGKASDTVSAVKELNAMHGFNAPQKLDVNGLLAIQRIERVVVDK